MSVNYTIEKIENGVATVRYQDDSYAHLTLAQDMLPEDVDDLAAQFAPKTGVAPAYLSVGETRAAVVKPAEEPLEPEELPVTYAMQRLDEYGSSYEQIEFITENGLEAWQAKVAAIKAKYPKPDDE